jgi:hypothetical protein
MKKHKRVFAMPGYISFVKDRLPLYEHHEFLGVSKEEVKNEWKFPDSVPLLFRSPVEKTKKKQEKEKDGTKQALKYTTQEVRKSKEEDKEALKDVEKLEEHLEEDVEKAEKKLKK